MKINPKIFIIVIYFFSLGYSAQNNSSWYTVVDSLQEIKLYADAHRFLWKLNHLPSATDSTIGVMVLNAFEHYYIQKNEDIYFLKNGMDYKDIKGKEVKISPFDTDLVIFKKPLPWIKRALELNSTSGIGQFLMGYYTQKKYIPNFYQSDFPPPNIRKIEKDIAIYYEKAFLYGFRHRLLFKYLGDYYYRNRIFHRAKRFYRWNVKKEYFDPESVIQLAMIYLKDNEAQKALSYAFLALPYFENKDIEVQYLAYRIIANANSKLGNHEKFKYYNELSRELLPDKADAYLDLIEYYEQKNDTDSVLVWTRTLFLTNPFETSNYEILPYYARKYGLTKEFIALLDQVEEKYREYDLVLAYLYWKKGDLYYLLGEQKKSNVYWQKSKIFFSKLGGPNASIIKKIGTISRLQ